MKTFLYGFIVATIICGLFFYAVYSDFNQQTGSTSMTAITVEPKEEPKEESLEQQPETSPTITSLNQVTNPKVIQIDNSKKHMNATHRIDYNVASPSEILPTISSDKGILGSNTESFLTSSQFENILISLEKTSEEAYQVQDNVFEVVHSQLQAYADIHIRNDLNCDDRICLMAVEFDSYDNLRDFSRAILESSSKSMAGTVAVIKEDGQKVARFIYNHKNAAFIHSLK